MEDLARVRVFARSADGERVPLVGLVPRDVIEEIRDRVEEAAAGGERVRLVARIKQLEPVKVGHEGRDDARPASRVVLGVSVKDASPSQEEKLRASIESLLRGAVAAKDAAEAAASLTKASP